MHKPPVIAIINTSPDVVEMLRIAFEVAGIVAVSTYSHEIRSGAIDIGAFMRQHRPNVVLYDIAPPYPNNWLLFQHLATLPAFEGIPLILTTTNKAQMDKLALGSGLDLFEIVGTPFNLHELVEEVRRALGVNPAR